MPHARKFLPKWYSSPLEIGMNEAEGGVGSGAEAPQKPKALARLCGILYPPPARRERRATKVIQSATEGWSHVSIASRPLDGSRGEGPIQVSIAGNPATEKELRTQRCNIFIASLGLRCTTSPAVSWKSSTMTTTLVPCSEVQASIS